MPIVHRFSPDWNCRLARFSGKVTVAEVRAFMDAGLADERIRPGHLRFTDVRGTTDPLDTPTMTSFARLSLALEEKKPAQRSAILVGSNVDLGMARVFIGHMGMDGGEWDVFRNVADGLAFLGLPIEDGDPFDQGEWTEILTG